MTVYQAWKARYEVIYKHLSATAKVILAAIVGAVRLVGILGRKFHSQKPIGISSWTRVSLIIVLIGVSCC